MIDFTFKDFIFEDTMGNHGEYKNDAAEKTMIHYIMDLAVGDNGGTTPKTDKNYDLAYSFLESDLGGILWDKYYELFKEKDPKFEGPLNRPKMTRFKKEVRELYAKWKKTQ